MQKEIVNNSIPNFDRNNKEQNFSAIGIGSLGGKASGLVFINQILQQKFKQDEFPSIKLTLPKMTVLRTGVFDSFMEKNDLYDFVLKEESDIRIADKFLKADLPAEILGDLRSLIENEKTPLAVRSSSMLEDAKYEPFAGVYSTKMIPNNQPGIDNRFTKLLEAIKFVFASTYFRAAKNYFKSSSHKIEDEKMAVIIQNVVGQNYNMRFYPNISGVARSYNFYPVGKSKREHGVVNLALGLGKTIVDGGISWIYSPQYPKSPPPFNDPKDILKSTQNNFWAVNLNPVVNYDPTKETEYLSLLKLNDADYDNNLTHIASTYDAQSDRIEMGVGREGPRIINFSPLLHLNKFGFNDLIKRILLTCEEAYNNPVEIEFAATISKSSELLNFAFLQVRPMVISTEVVDIEKGNDNKNILVESSKVMGNGTFQNIFDVVFVKPEMFDKKNTTKIAEEIESINKKLVEENKPYVLIGFGRWGSSDPWLGVPVEWGQISGAKVIVESTLFDINVELSQGSHFFHNINSFNVSYFSINYDEKFKIDWNWLHEQEIVNEKIFSKHVKLKNSLLIKIDGRTGRGIIWKSIPIKIK